MLPLLGIASEMTQKPTVHDKLLELWPLCVLLVFLAYMLERNHARAFLKRNEQWLYSTCEWSTDDAVLTRRTNSISV